MSRKCLHFQVRRSQRCVSWLVGLPSAHLIIAAGLQLNRKTRSRACSGVRSRSAPWLRCALREGFCWLPAVGLCVLHSGREVVHRASFGVVICHWLSLLLLRGTRSRTGIVICLLPFDFEFEAPGLRFEHWASQWCSCVSVTRGILRLLAYVQKSPDWVMRKINSFEGRC